MIRNRYKKQLKIFLATLSLTVAIVATISISQRIQEKQMKSSRAGSDNNTKNSLKKENSPKAKGLIIKYKQGKEGSVNKEIQKYSAKKPEKKFERVYTIEVAENQIETAMAEIQRSDTIEYVEPNFYHQYLFTPNDPLFDNQWWLKKIEAEKAWDVTKGKENIKVGILDSGITNNHSDLSSKVKQWKNFIGGDPYDDFGHGTAVGGIVGAITNNNIGTSSIGYYTSLASLKVGDSEGALSTSIAEAIRWAADNNLDIISMSFGSSEKSRTIEEAIEYAWNKGVFIVAAAGNTGKTKAQYPAAYSHVFSVAATEQNDEKTDFSTYGGWVDISAPGVEILSTSKSGKYESATGTSLSAPIVAGVAALVKSIFPNYTNEKIEQVLCDSADKIKGTGSAWRCGRVNAFKAVSSVSLTSPAPAPQPSPTPAPTPTPDSRNKLKINIRFQGITRKANNQNILVELYKESNIAYKEEKNTENNEEGIYSFIIDNISEKITPDNYDIRIKGESHLGKKFKGVEIKPTNSTVNLTLEDIKAGDVNNDNKITIGDIAQVLSYYTAFSVKVNEDDSKMVRSDINKDGKITIVDVAIAALNWSSFNISGE